ncbi:hypothetical protein [Paraburkholderia sediminicola]|uniref:hypothetical protein n=1 Tax=Paraburkholderia sediminicola TaxID=458836 RepID=UPI000EAE915A
MELAESELARQRADCKAKFLKLRQSNASPIDLGRFFDRLLADGVWATQGTLAEGIGESPIKVSRCLKLIRVPHQIARVFGARGVSRRTATFLTKITAHIGEQKLLENASRVGVRNDLTVREILSALQTGNVSGEREADRKNVRLIGMPNEEYLRLYLPNTTKLSKHEIGRLEAKLELAMQMLSSLR